MTTVNQLLFVHRENLQQANVSFTPITWTDIPEKTKHTQIKQQFDMDMYCISTEDR